MHLLSMFFRQLWAIFLSEKSSIGDQSLKQVQKLQTSMDRLDQHMKSSQSAQPPAPLQPPSMGPGSGLFDGFDSGKGFMRSDQAPPPQMNYPFFFPTRNYDFGFGGSVNPVNPVSAAVNPVNPMMMSYNSHSNPQDHSDHQPSSQRVINVSEMKREEYAPMAERGDPKQEEVS